MFGPQRTSAHLGSAASGAHRQLRPDPRGHALALIESFGYRCALEIARNNAFIERSREDYWPRVLDAVRNAHA